MEKIVFLDRETVPAQFKKPAFAHEWREYPQTSEAETLARLRDATIAISNKVALREDVLRELPALRLICVAATGYDRFDIAYCRRRGIVVTNIPDYARVSVPEHVLMMILALRRNLFAYRAAVAAGAWQKSESFCVLDYPIHDISTTTLGIVGYGTLGRAIDKLARAFGMRTLIGEHKNAVQIRDGRTAFADLIKCSDIITLHCPLNDETRNLIGAEELAQMPPHALLINCARGGVVNEAALVDALRAGKIAGAGVDVLTIEPPRVGNVLLDAADLPNLIVTPHNAWASREAVQTLADTVIANMEAYINGRTQNVVA